MGKSAKALLVALILCITFIVVIGSIYYYKEIYLYKTDYIEYVENAARKYNVDIYMIFAIIKVESAFDIQAISPVGAIGLMQIMPKTADYIYNEDIDKDKLFNAEFNIDTGVRYISYLKEKFDEIRWLLIAYNAGETIAIKWQKQGLDEKTIPYKETRDYVNKVLQAIQRYKELYYFY